MRKLLFSLFFVCLSTFQHTYSQCDLDFSFVNTGTNFTAFFTPPAASGIYSELGAGTVGAFFMDESENYVCGASSEFTGNQIQLAVMGDDATTDEKDGFNAGEEILWFYQTTSGDVYSLSLTPSDVFTANGMSFISAYTTTMIDCSGGSTSCDYNFEYVNTGSNMTAFFTPPTASAIFTELGEGTVGAFFMDENENSVCGASSEFTGDPVQLAIMGDDATTIDAKDGFADSEEILWIYQTTDGTTYSLSLTPSDTYTTNGSSMITAYTASEISCGSSDIEGCTDVEACNYNAEATADNGSCTYAEENYDCNGNCLNDVDNDGICDEEEIVGCTDSEACNFDNSATDDSGNCSYADMYYDCSGVCVNDVDADGVCDELEVEGCMDVSACNYDAVATDDSSDCLYAELNYDCDGSCINDSDLDGICDELEVEGCMDESACNYNHDATDQTVECIYVTGLCDECSGETNGTGYIVDNDADDDGICNEDEEGACVDINACNYNDDLTVEEDNSLCIYAEGCDECSGQTDGSGVVIDNDEDNDGVCNEDEIEGCTETEACNYNSAATEQDDSCVYPIGCETCSGETNGLGQVVDNDFDNDGICNADEISGCQDVNACNYDSNATDSDGSCLYAELYYGCNGECINDTDGDSVCDELEIDGCTDDSATNYNESATDDDGSCEYDIVDCVLPNGLVVNTGANMTVLLTPTFIQSLNVQNTDAYVVALTDYGLVVGSVLVHDSELNNGQAQMILWADDTTTDDQDGALNGDFIIFQLVDGNNLYSISDSGIEVTILYTANGISIQSASVEAVFSCSGSIAGISGCTDESACNYNENATEDDGSCFDADPGYSCNGVCLVDTDNDGVCDEFEVVGCTDPFALNFDPLVTDEDNSLCIFPEIVEGCTDETANNFNPEANLDDGSCLYGIGGCTYSQATNYNPDATYEDESCVFDTPAIYVTNPVDGAIFTESNISVVYEVVNINISSLSEDAHIKYSVDGGSYGTLFDQEGIITQEFEDGNHTIHFILYDNVTGNSQPWIPTIETTVSFIVGPEGCMNPEAGNFNPAAVVDNGTCIPNAGLEFLNENTGGNHTIMVLMQSFIEIDVNGLISQPGDLLGVFFENNGSYIGAGYDTITGDNIQIAAWGDDATTEEQDGFIDGQSFVWAIQYAETGNSVFLEAVYGSGPETYTGNGLSTIIGFEIMEFGDIEGCMNSDYVEYNPFATIDDGSCLTLKVHGCTDVNYLEYWVYDSLMLSIEEPVEIPNTNDGSCVTLIEEGCTDGDYTEYCETCNVSNVELCTTIIVEGCTDPEALNYNELANTDDGTCDYDLCIHIEVNNFEVITSTALNIPVLSYDIINSSSEEISSPSLSLNLDSDLYFEISASVISTSQINPGDTVHVEGVLINDLTSLPPYVFISGYVQLQGESFESGEVNCEISFEEELIPTAHIGCSDTSAYNYEPLATVNDGSCIEYVNASVMVADPLCSDTYGAASIFLTGGLPPYSSPSIYTQYSDFGITQIVDVVVDENNVVSLTGLADGEYLIEIHDSYGIIEFYEFSIESPEELVVEANIANSGLLTSNVVAGDAIMYQWLFEGEAIEGANNTVHFADMVGNYQVYIENENGCGDYSEEVYLNTVGVEELSANSFTVFPNPTQSKLNINLTQLNEAVVVNITDVLGQVLETVDVDSRESNILYSMDVTDLPNGIYFINVKGEVNQFVKRFVKN